ncbi:MAG: hypothetical protein ABH950_00225 [Candidatus Altiarchaeota archaeon]
MTFRNRGQSALEYLMTYGWAILVVIGVGVAMWQMGVLNIGSSAVAPGKRGFSQVSPLDWSLSGDGVLTIVLTNDAGVRVEVSNVAATIYTPSTASCGNDYSGAPLEVRPGQQISSTLTFGGGCDPFSSDSGEYYRANVTILYLNKGSSLEHSSVGEIFGPVE